MVIISYIFCLNVSENFHKNCVPISFSIAQISVFIFKYKGDDGYQGEEGEKGEQGDRGRAGIAGYVPHVYVAPGMVK